MEAERGGGGGAQMRKLQEELHDKQLEVARLRAVQQQVRALPDTAGPFCAGRATGGTIAATTPRGAPPRHRGPLLRGAGHRGHHRRDAPSIHGLAGVWSRTRITRCARTGDFRTLAAHTPSGISPEPAELPVRVFARSLSTLGPTRDLCTHSSIFEIPRQAVGVSPLIAGGSRPSLVPSTRGSNSPGVW